MPSSLSRLVYRRLDYFLAFGFGSGLISVAPGTWGTVMGVGIYLLMMYLSWYSYLMITLVAFFIGVKACESVASHLGIHDYSGIVWDEIVGYLATMFMAPKGWIWVILGFILFRIFDIAKPYPINKIDQKVKGGLGIMLDDIAAAVPALIILQGLAWSFK